MTSRRDLIIIGAGPAGITAARQAARWGLDYVLLDEQSHPGGNVYRNVTRLLATAPDIGAALGRDYQKGARIMAHEFLNETTYLPDTQVWSISQDGEIGIKRNGRLSLLKADKVLIATGAMERPVPLPGWTLPGVMSLGAAQTLLKSARLVPTAAPVIIGSGPLVFLVITQYLRLGVVPKAVLLTGPSLGRSCSLSSLAGALCRPLPLMKGVTSLIRSLLGAGKVHTNVTDIEIMGVARASAVAFHQKGRRQVMAAETIFLHEGVVPNTVLTMAAGCEHVWNEQQYCWTPALDDWGRTSAGRIYVAGDSAKIMGAAAAVVSGTLALASIAAEFGKISEAERDRLAAPLKRRLNREARFRRFLDQKYAPPASIRHAMADRVVVCRCENVTAGDIRGLTDIHCTGPNQAKSFTRCGMGPCQGRMCGLAVTEIMAAEQGRSCQEVGYYRVRPPVKPLSVGEIASLDDGDPLEMKMTLGQ